MLSDPTRLERRLIWKKVRYQHDVNWIQSASLLHWRYIEAKNHIPFFDVAYQGFASGSLEEDAASVRLFADKAGRQRRVKLDRPAAWNAPGFVSV